MTEGRARFFRRLGYYCTGLAIGFVMLGVIQMGRQSAHQRRLVEEEARRQMLDQGGDESRPQDPQRSSEGTDDASGGTSDEHMGEGE